MSKTRTIHVCLFVNRIHSQRQHAELFKACIIISTYCCLFLQLGCVMNCVLVINKITSVYLIFSGMDENTRTRHMCGCLTTLFE